ncbi:MAG TPA: AraC family transcriptional regulator [Spirochaetales bacterium]|nr:AraC family transcriptional regulator [Spirochaetales bacterium]HPS15536.1 AraC family transcriptional regulator [Spirochaetales bacterium]
MGFNSFFKYVTSSSRDLAWGIYCIDAGGVEIKPGEPYPYQANFHPPQYSRLWEKGRTLSEFQLVYIAKGEGNFRNQQGEVGLQAGSLMVLLPGRWHWYRPKIETGWVEYWVGFDGDYPQFLRAHGFFGDEAHVIEVGVHESIIALYNRILDAVSSETPGYQQVASSIIPQIYAEALAYSQQQELEPSKKELFEKVLSIFQAHIYSSLDMESLAKDLNLNYATFREDFKGYTGLSPYQYFLEMKINKAKEMLSDGVLSVKEVSYKLAFQSPYYFSRLFKKKTGVVPSQWNGIEIAED